MKDQATADTAIALAVDWGVIDGVAGTIGVAVSGGSDSTALAVLLAEHRRGRIGALVTVDHGLRQDAAVDIAAVRSLGERLDVPVVTHTLNPQPPPRSAIQAWARDARHRLFADLAVTQGWSAVALGHTLDDQAETFLMRLGRGSGVRGLGAMRPATTLGGLTLIRPLLACRRTALRAVLATRGIGWREDPSNTNRAFTRVAIREALPALAPLGLTPERLATTASHLARASDAVDAWANQVLAAVSWDRAGAAALPLHIYFRAPSEARLRALATLLQRIGGKPFGADINALGRVDAALCGPHVSRTLGRVRIVRDGEVLALWREARGFRPVLLHPGEHANFDGRFRITAVDTLDGPVSVGALGEELARRLPAVGRCEARATAPAITAEGRFLAAPTLGIWTRRFPRGSVRFEPLHRADTTTSLQTESWQ